MIATADRLLMGYKWGLLLRVAGVRSSMWNVLRTFYQANFTGVFMPSHVGGDLLRAYWVMQETGLRYPVFASLVVERVLGLIAAVNWAILGGTVFAATLAPERLWLWLAAGCAATVAANLAFGLLLSTRLHDIVLTHLGQFRGAKLVRLVHKLYEACASYSGAHRALAINLLLTLLEQALQMLLIVGIAWSIGVTVDPVAFIAASALYLLALRVPIAPDGWGVGELTAIGVFALVGVSATESFTVSLIGHVIPMLALSPGFFFLMQRRVSRAAEVQRR
jgi:uncharacterized protein (TIRG00374 family)